MKVFSGRRRTGVPTAAAATAATAATATTVAVTLHGHLIHQSAPSKILHTSGEEKKQENI